jgi:hypothetical protein
MPLIYRGKKITPAPYFNMVTNIERSDNNRVKKISYVFTFKSKLLAYMGSPNGLTNDLTSFDDDPDAAISSVIAADPDQRQKLIQNKIAAMQALFCKEGYWCEIQPWDGSAPIKFIPKIRSIDFGDNSGRNAEFFEYVNYTIVMETDKVFLGATSDCDVQFAPDESWSIESNDDKQRTYRVTHSLSCSMLDKYLDDGSGGIEQRGWERARDLVNAGVGISAEFLQSAVKPFTATTNPNNVLNWLPYNRVRNINTDELAGKYSLTEQWVLFDGPAAIEDFTVSTKTSADDGRMRVTIDGTITGYTINQEDSIAFSADSTRYTNAQSYFAGLVGAVTFYNRACLYSTNTPNSLNPIPIAQSVGHNPNNGVINYNVEYDNRKCFLTAGALNETLTISDELPSDVFAQLVAIGRPIGPILQSIGTVTASKRTISLDVTMPSTYTLTCSTFATKPDTDSIIALFIPSASQIFKERDSINWSPTTGKYNRSVTFTFTS